jgi:hypothetical protein
LRDGTGLCGIAVDLAFDQPILINRVRGRNDPERQEMPQRQEEVISSLQTFLAVIP